MRKPGELIGGKYRLQRPLANGGMGAVWVAHHVELETPVAVKFMLSASARELDLIRFKREARAAARLKSPHIAHVYDYGVEADGPYIAMELLEGETLRDRLARHPRCSVAYAASFVVQVARGLRIAHEAGIIHRDLKPSNLFIERSADDEVVKILDFGIAKAPQDVSEGTASHGVIVGSPGYMSPEQAKGETVEHYSDLWSLGVVLFRMLTGKDPFAAANATQTIAKICTATFPRATSLVPELPHTIDEFFERAFALEPSRRFASATALSQALTEIARAQASITGDKIAWLERENAPEAPNSGLPGRTSETRPIDESANAMVALAPAPVSQRSRFGTLALILTSLIGVGALYFFTGREQIAPPPLPAQAQPSSQATASGGDRRASASADTQATAPIPTVSSKPTATLETPPASPAPPSMSANSVKASRKQPSSPAPASVAPKKQKPIQEQTKTPDPIFGLPVTRK